VSGHRFINDGRSAIPMGSENQYGCICGKRGTKEAIARHIAEQSPVDEDTSGKVVVTADSSDFGGDTMAHYLPHEPRKPARLDTPEPLPPPPSTPSKCPTCQAGEPVADLPEISAWSCGHWIHKYPRSIAELFQDMLRFAFQGGVAAATAGESFETWYQREVLR
jgi:hypothetical protein